MKKSPRFALLLQLARPSRQLMKKIVPGVMALGLAGLSLTVRAQDAPSGLLCNLLTHPEKSFITDAKPDFGWIVNSSRTNEVQSAYQLLVSSSLENLTQNKGDLWDSGQVASGQSINVNYGGNALKSSTSYWWKVQTWNREGQPSGYSQPQRFNIGELDRAKSWPGESRWLQIPDQTGIPMWTFENRSPVSYHPYEPDKITPNADGSTFIDFGRAAFSALDLTLTWQPSDPATTQCAVTVDVGEKNRGTAVDQKPGGGIIYARIEVRLQPGKHTYPVPIPRFVPRYPESQSLPPEMREVIPFRYCQVRPGKENVIVEGAEQQRLNIEFDDQASSFASSNEVLNQVYDLCKYSIKVNTFNGDYANSERERMLYEADSYIEQTSHYAIDREYAIARYSSANMIYHATWPTEWIPHCVFMAYADYLNTGNTKFISQYYDELKAKTLLALAGADGLVSSRTGLQTPEFLSSIHYPHGQLKDIVDWPKGETDGFVFCNINTEVNTFHYRALVLMEKIATALAKTDDAAFYHQHAAQVKAAFNEKFLDAQRGIYIDGIGTDHASLHANLFALAFGLVPPDHVATVVGFIKSRGMACSVYPTIYLLEALYDAGEDQYALDLMTSDSDRSWLNMIRIGSTVTTEAWDVKYKANEGWTHAWSTAPVQIIPRKLMGIETLEPGYGKVLIEPRPGNLTKAKVLLPTIRGPISAEFDRGEALGYFHLTVSIPSNMTAEIALPLAGNSSASVLVDGQIALGRIEGEHVFIDKIGSGKHTVSR